MEGMVPTVTSHGAFVGTTTHAADFMCITSESGARLYLSAAPRAEPLQLGHQ